MDTASTSARPKLSPPLQKIYQSVRNGHSTANQAIEKRASPPASSVFREALASAEANWQVVQKVCNGDVKLKVGLGSLKRPDAWIQGLVHEAAELAPVCVQVRNGKITMEEALRRLGYPESPMVRDSLRLAEAEFRIKKGSLTAAAAVRGLQITNSWTSNRLDWLGWKSKSGGWGT